MFYGLKKRKRWKHGDFFFSQKLASNSFLYSEAERFYSQYSGTTCCQQTDTCMYVQMCGQSNNPSE